MERPEIPEQGQAQPDRSSKEPHEKACGTKGHDNAHERGAELHQSLWESSKELAERAPKGTGESHERVCLVTGASGDIGAAICAAFHNAGWSVIGTDRREPRDVSVLTEFIQTNLQTCDNRLFSRCIERYGKLNCLINNAAFQSDSPLVATSDNDWDHAFNVNLKRPFQLIRDLHSYLALTKGSIINIGSVHAIATSANVAAYSISKGALSSLTRYAALELAPFGVRCNSILPGAVDTKMLKEGLHRRPHPDGAQGNLQNLIDKTPLGFVASPNQIAQMVLALTNDAAFGYMTGQCIVADGGASLRLATE